MSDVVQFLLIDHVRIVGLVMFVVCSALKVMAHRSGAFRQ